MTKAFTGKSPIQLLGIELVSESKSRFLTATEIGKLVSSDEAKVSAQKVNKILESLGYQEQYEKTYGGKAWKMTEKGKAFGVLIDSGQRDGEGTAIQQLKWLQDIVKVVEESIAKTRNDIHELAKKNGLRIVEKVA